MLERPGNVEMLETVPSIDDVLSRTSVLLMPSLWYEGFGLITMEAMLRGIPVIASDSGGLDEASFFDWCRDASVVPVAIEIAQPPTVLPDFAFPDRVAPDQEKFIDMSRVVWFLAQPPEVFV